MKPEFYTDNEAYAQRLRAEDPRRFQSLPRFAGNRPFHAKYVAALAAGLEPGVPVLDVGSGAGQAVAALQERGLRSIGVDVSGPGVALAREAGLDCRTYDGAQLPFEDASMAAVGACNVLEHVEAPVAFLDELARVVRPGGRMVISSPNFLRVLGWRDYHPRMAGLRQKGRNLRTLLQHGQLYREYPATVVFEPMAPIVRPEPRPDDDATVATNALDLRQYFRTRGFGAITVSCVDRPVPRFLEMILDATPLRFGLLNAFVTARKPAART
jgi:SAM-dependent methyltransferase